MKKILVVLVALVAFSFAANASSYSVNDASIDALFAEATMEAPAPAGIVNADGQTKTLIAFVIDTIGLGAIGIHRLILGTKPVNVVWYILTFGGIFCLIPFIDWIMMLIDLLNGSASFINNPAFIMWL